MPPSTIPLTTELPITTPVGALDISGVWVITIDVIATGGDCDDEEPYRRVINVRQAGDVIEVIGLGDGEEAWGGSVDADVVVFKGERGEDKGITTATFELKIDPDAEELTGFEYWTWTDGRSTCPDGLSDVRAVRF